MLKIISQLYVILAVTWHSQETRLTIHYENGFTLTDARSGIDSSGKSQILWSFPFDRLKMSADDGQRLLWLDFGGDEGEQVSEYNRFIFLFQYSFLFGWIKNWLMTFHQCKQRLNQKIDKVIKYGGVFLLYVPHFLRNFNTNLVSHKGKVRETNIETFFLICSIF